MGCSNSILPLTATQEKRLNKIAGELGMTGDDIKKLYKYFNKVPLHYGRIDIEAFATKNGFLPGVFALVVRTFDAKYIDFEEFFLVFYDLITTKFGDFPTYIYQMLDVDESGMLTHEEALRLIATLNSENLVPMPMIIDVMKKRASEGLFALKTLKTLCGQFTQLMAPVLHMQQTMIEQSIGIVRAKALNDIRDKRFENLALVQILEQSAVRPLSFSKLPARTTRYETVADKVRITNAHLHTADSVRQLKDRTAVRANRRSLESVPARTSIRKQDLPHFETVTTVHGQPSERKSWSSDGTALRKADGQSTGTGDGNALSRQEIKPKPVAKRQRHRRVTN